MKLMHPRASRRALAPLRNRKFADSPLEGDGFEPSVPRKAPGIVAVSALVRGVFPLAGDQACHAEPMVRIRLPPAESRTNLRIRWLEARGVEAHADQLVGKRHNGSVPVCSRSGSTPGWGEHFDAAPKRALLAHSARMLRWYHATPGARPRDGLSGVCRSRNSVPNCVGMSPASEQ